MILPPGSVKSGITCLTDTVAHNNYHTCQNLIPYLQDCFSFPFRPADGVSMLGIVQYFLKLLVKSFLPSSAKSTCPMYMDPIEAADCGSHQSENSVVEEQDHFSMPQCDASSKPEVSQITLPWTLWSVRHCGL